MAYVVLLKEVKRWKSQCSTCSSKRQRPTREKHKKPPIVLDVEIYEYFGEPCEIVAVNIYRGGGAEVTVCKRFGDRVDDRT